MKKERAVVIFLKKLAPLFNSIAGLFIVLWRCFSKRACALAIACQSISNPNAAACLKQNLRRITAFSAVAVFVCHMRASLLRIFICVISEMAMQSHLGSMTL